MFRFISFFILVVPCFMEIGFSQSVRGIVSDPSDNSPVAGATVQLLDIKDSSAALTVVSNKRGSFLFPSVPHGIYILVITSTGYQVGRFPLLMADAAIDLKAIQLVKSATVLNNISIIAAAPPVKQKQDTLEYSADAFKVNPDANAEDLIKKMPGVTVDKGTVTAQGETVKKVTVDGREFFGDDATAALRNLPSEVIDKIQIFDKLSDQAAFTGFDDGNASKSINIVTKANMRNGQFGRVYAGYGTNDRYSTGGNVSFFKGNRRLSFVGLFNNTNQQNFSSQDLLGVTSSQNRGGGGQKGGPRGQGGGFQGGAAGGVGGNTSNFQVGAQSGISKTNAIGLNYSDVWGKKLTISGSYFYNNSNTPNIEIDRQEFKNQNPDSVTIVNQTNNSSNDNYNNRANLRIEYKIDSFNSFLITPNISFQSNRSSSLLTGTNSFKNGSVISQTANHLNSKSDGYNISNGILFRHAFQKRGRTISLFMTTSRSNKTADNYLMANNQYFKPFLRSDSVNQLSDSKTYGNNLSFNVAYTEPIGKKGQLQLNYSPSFTTTNADQETYHYDYPNSKYSKFDTTLSNKFLNHANAQNGGASYRYGDKDNQFSAGLSYQYSTLTSDQQFPRVTIVRKTFNNIIPNLMARMKLSAKSSIRVFYRTSTSAPSITQLQNVYNNSNQLFYTTGNPDLRQQYSHNLFTRFTFTNTLKGQSFFANLFLQSTNDYVANATYTASRDSLLGNNLVLHKGSRISKPVNTSGYLSARSFFTYGLPVKFIKSTFNLNVGLSYTNAPGVVDNIVGSSKSTTYNLGAVVASNISQYVDFTVSYSGNINHVKNSISPQQNDNYFTQTAGLQANLLTKTGWFLQNDITNQSYKGLANGFNQSYFLWNAAVGKKFLKSQNGEVKLSVFDLLQQNQSITRNTSDPSYIEDIQNQVLQQYFMLTFTYKLKNFGKAPPPGNHKRGMEDFR